MTSKQRSYLKGIAMTTEPVLQIGKSSLTPELTAAVEEVLEARELVKITVLKNCLDDGKTIAAILAERTHAEVVQVIGKKIVLYRPAKDEKKRKIILPAK
ncbi:MAG: ribosome assembly RNA-binding protein YhbY [Lachnospiraceae bacterium]|jgi:RNA-binding protein|nr:ribosome assembly RNA-binding protein YhbY [Lachnospiraceae bacterium]